MVCINVKEDVAVVDLALQAAVVDTADEDLDATVVAGTTTISQAVVTVDVATTMEAVGTVLPNLCTLMGKHEVDSRRQTRAGRSTSLSR